MTKKLIGIILILLIIGGAIFFITETRAPSAPSESINSALASAAITSSAPGTLYHISQASSTVSFQIGEVLHGSPAQPIGTTTQIAGDITVSSSTVSFGPIAIDARTWTTDSKQRNGAIDRLILHAEDPANEFMRFSPTSVTGAPASIMPGDTLSLQVSGDLTISGVTQPATFDVTMNVGADSLTGTASTTLKRSDFNLIIPNIPFVADVTDQFTVTANITADLATTTTE